MNAARPLHRLPTDADALVGETIYEPFPRGEEAKIKTRLDTIRKR